MQTTRLLGGVIAIVTAAGCAGPAKPKSRVALSATPDTAFLKLCAAPPETTANGVAGCLLKDQRQPPRVIYKPH